MTRKIDMWIGGEYVESESGKYYEDLNPRDDSVYATVSHGTEKDADKAIKAAHEAFQSYQHTSPLQRETWISNSARLLEERESEIVDILVDEVGSPIFKAKIEVGLALSCIKAAIGIPRRLTGKTFPSDFAGRISQSFRSPLGVSVNISPFNVPLILGARCVNPLATGNTTVLLPSEEAPCVAEFLAKLFKDAGFPDGSFNYVTGFGHEIGDSLTGHELTKAVVFTGSTRVGNHIAGICGSQKKRVVLELGGKSPMVILGDADLSKAVPAATHSSFAFQGQACMASSRILVESSIFDDFVSQLKASAEKLGRGDLRDSSTIIGPIINPRQRDRVSSHIKDAVDKGATLVTGGTWEDNVCAPTILTGVDEEMTVCRQETFGPVTSVYKVDNYEEALEKANDTVYGLSAAIFTSDLNRAMHFTQNSTSGMVHVNASTIQDEPHVPFGGTGESGFDREGIEAAIESMTEQKWVTIQT